jgi:hypothetical protein
MSKIVMKSDVKQPPAHTKNGSDTRILGCNRLGENQSRGESRRTFESGSRQQKE